MLWKQWKPISRLPWHKKSLRLLLNFEIFQLWDISTLRYFNFEIFQLWDISTLAYFNFEIFQLWSFPAERSIRRYFNLNIFQFWDNITLRFSSFIIFQLWGIPGLTGMDGLRGLWLNLKALDIPDIRNPRWIPFNFEIFQPWIFYWYCFVSLIRVSTVNGTCKLVVSFHSDVLKIA